jgi:hypothetical protein
VGAQLGKDLADVVQETFVRADDEHVLGPEDIVEQQPGDPVQAHGRLSGSRASLDDKHAFAVVGDQQELLALGGLDDVAHVPAAGTLEVLQQEVLEIERFAIRSVGGLVRPLGQ